MPPSQSISSSMHSNLSPYFADGSWEWGRCVWPSVTATNFLLFRRRRERADSQWYSRLPVRWITHQTRPTRSTKKEAKLLRRRHREKRQHSQSGSRVLLATTRSVRHETQGCRSQSIWLEVVVFLFVVYGIKS